MEKSGKESQDERVLANSTLLSRRTFLAGGAISLLGSAAAAATYSAASASPSDLQVVSSTIPLQNLPTSFEGFRIGFISDLHLSPVVGEGTVEVAGDLLNKRSIDLLVLGGDYVWAADSSIEREIFSRYASFKGLTGTLSSHDEVFRATVRLSERVKTSAGGVAIYGNHDRRFMPRACENAFKGCRSISLLRNEKRTVKRGDQALEIIGVDDFLTGIPSNLHFRSPPPPGLFRVVLSHNPDFFVSQAGSTNFHLGLAGHTHGGQINLPFVGAPTYNIKFSSYRHGLYTEPSRSIYVTKGIGMVGLPFRINCPPEVSILTLVSV